MNEKVKQALDEALHPDEKILWQSDVRHFRMLDGNEGHKTLFGWCVCILVIGGMVMAYTVNTGKGIGVYVVAATALAIIILSPILSYRQTLGLHFCITDRRVMTIRPDGVIYDMDRRDAGDVRLYKADDGAAVAIGSGLLEEKDKQLRWRSNHPLVNSRNEPQGLVFYRPEHAEEAVRLLRSEGV